MSKGVVSFRSRLNWTTLMAAGALASSSGCQGSSSKPSSLIPVDPRLDLWSNLELYVGGPEWVTSQEIQKEVESSGSIVYFDDVIARMGSLPVSKPFDYMYGWKFTNITDPQKPWLHHHYEMFYVVVRTEAQDELYESIEEIKRLYWP